LSKLTGLLWLAPILLLTSAVALAHPADEFCTPDSGLDPELCRALAEADRAVDVETGSDARGMLDAEQTERVRQAIKLDRPWWRTAALYLRLGFEHILPKGLDHILFVLALFFASTRLKPLFLQISVFTIAHTMTLGLAAAGWVKAPTTIVEPLIALSIAFVAVENLFARHLTPWRPVVVFGFGLFHGLGFASVLIDLGLPDDQFLTALVGFNIGVELGQISIVLAAWWILRWWFDKPWYRPRIMLPASFLIAVTGSWWAVQRIFGL
jgi:hypothetical protein